jgi:uncharacterized protein YceK
MNRFVRSLLLLASLLLALGAGGCATIITGTHGKVAVTSNPPAASVTVKRDDGGGYIQGTALTPVTFKLPKDHGYVVEIKLAGYRDQQVWVNREFNAWVVGNICLGMCSYGSLLIIGGVIDFADGAMWRLDPDKIHVEMATAMLDEKPQLYAMLLATDDNGQLRRLAVPMVPQWN